LVKIIFKFILLIISVVLYGQQKLNSNTIKKLYNEKFNFSKNQTTFLSKNNKNQFQITFNNKIYYNTNLPNLENQNGFYFPKGTGLISGFLFHYNGKYLKLTAEPQISGVFENTYSLRHKEKLVSTLNNSALKYFNRTKINNFRNMGLAFQYSGFSLGYANWDQWWGPGIHNSIVMSNNAEGIPHYFVGTMNYQPLRGDLDYYFKYMVSDAMYNNAGTEYFLSAYYFNLRYKNIEVGKSRHILNGGYNDLLWSLNDAINVFVTKKYMKYWDQIVDYYISVSFPSSGLKVFIEVGFPNRSFNGENIQIYSDHAMGTNLGLRKYGAFGKDEILFGFEYTRLVQGLHYNILPTPNWYDNIKYNYSSYNGRRWAAHSGSDSDDFLVFMGYMKDQFSFIYGLNYERHGVTYHFPPEVKIESRISVSFKYKNIFFYLNYENEHFEHYGFVDENRNVWEETFETGSIQRTQTLLISVEHTFSF